MANNVKVLTKLQELIKAETSLSFVKDIFIGARNNVINFPSVFIIPESENETPDTYPHKRITFNISLYGIIKVLEADNCYISSDVNTIGLLDFLNRVKKFIDNNTTLSGEVINILYGNTEYGIDNGNLFFSLSISIEYRTYAGTR